MSPWITARQASLSITDSRSSLRLMSIESVMPSSHLILCHPLLLPPVPPSIRVFSNESTLRMRWPKYWSFSFSIIPSKEIPGLISFRMDWLDQHIILTETKTWVDHARKWSNYLEKNFRLIIFMGYCFLFGENLVRSYQTSPLCFLPRWTFAISHCSSSIDSFITLINIHEFTRFFLPVTPLILPVSQCPQRSVFQECRHLLL